MAAAAIVLLVLTVVGGSATLLEITGWMTAMWAGFLLVLGPQVVPDPLRADLARLAVLRSYPLRGSAVVGAETAASTAVLTALQLGLIGLAWLAFWGSATDARLISVPKAQSTLSAKKLAYLNQPRRRRFAPMAATSSHFRGLRLKVTPSEKLTRSEPIRMGVKATFQYE